MAPKKGRKPKASVMRRKIANMNAKRLQACVLAAESSVTLAGTAASHLNTPSEPIPLPEPTPSLPEPTSPLPEPRASMSASKRKLSLFEKVTARDTALPTTVVDLSTIGQLYAGVLCPQCRCSGLELCHNGAKDQALAVYLVLWCSVCEMNINTGYTSKRVNGQQAFEMNRKAVLTGLTVGLRHFGLAKISEGLGMPSMHHKSHSRHMDVITRVVPTIKANILEQARQKVREYYELSDTDVIGEDGVLNLGVSYDGSWAKRGHTSKIGVGAIIEIMTGLVVDYHVMSLYCQLCATVGERLKQDPRVYADWLQGHKQSGTCTCNYAGSSGGMEVAGARVLWGRSLEHGMRYTTFVGDGDAKTLATLKDMAPYGADFPIIKEECVNHVAKRLNTGLRNLVTTMSKQNIRLGGNKKGSLSAPKIGLLQSYYTTAVRTFNSSTQVMAKANWAGYFHSISTPEEQHHEDCPPGEDSWCWYQRALHAGQADPTRHRQQLSSTYLNSDVAPHVKKVYERLTDPALLGRCLLGKTQNTNESLHSVIWAKCPKHTFAGYNRVCFGATLAVGEYNMGSSACHLFHPAVGCPLTSATRAEKAHQAPQKRRREARKLAQQKSQQEAARAEGGPSYVSGGF